MSSNTSSSVQLSESGRELLARRLQRARSRDVATPTIPRRPDDTAAPLSFAQRRLWFLAQWNAASSAYNVPLALRLTGELQLAALEQVFNEIVQRHEVLRTSYRVVDEEPIQVLQAELTFSIPVVDLSALPPAERDITAHDLALKDAQQPFNLSTELPLRVTVLKLAETDHVLLVCLHHIACDGWGLEILFKEMVTLYQALCAGRPSPLPPLALQYADFAYWQQQWLRGNELKQQLAFWKKQLDGAPNALDLPMAQPRPPVRTEHGAIHQFRLPPALFQAIKTISLQEGITPFMLLLAAFQTLLHRYAAQEEIVVGSPIAGRNRPELEKLIGCFVNTLVLRVSFADNPTVRKLLQRVREVTLNAYAHQDLPFEKLVEELKPERNLSYSPFFQAMFVLDNTPRSTLAFGNTTARFLDIDNGTAQFDLTLAIDESEEGMVGGFTYNSDLFDRPTIQRMTEHFQVVLSGTLAHLDWSVADLPLLTEAERQQVLVAWNATDVEYPRDKRLHQWVEAQAEQTPDAVALVFEDQHLSYRELNRRANQVAHSLQALGIGSDMLVGICTERSLEMVVGLLGILKAGGAYVPLDPGYPADRLAFLVQDARLAAVLVQQQLQSRLPTYAGPVICLDTDWPTIGRQPATNLPCSVDATNLAYMIYTSGSTGRPKGAMNTHGAICNRLLWMQEAYQLTGQDRVLQKTPYSFDVSVWEFFWPLLTGACLVVARPDGHKDSAYLVRLIAEQQITTTHFVPSMLQMFVEEPDLERCSSLRRVVCSGEALPGDLQERFLARSRAELNNLYGPTEAAVDVTYWTCLRDQSLRSVPIGYPIANTQIYLLDRRGQPTPIGVPGELHIGGEGLARGYLNRADLTAERFIPDPFAPAPGARLYRTGDLAAYRPDGSIEFLGRLDFQVKIRGFRIELGEIEAVLNQHPAVRECVVLARELDNGTGPKSLVAYVIPQRESTLVIQGLRDFLRERLPEYMIPGVFMALDSFPLTSSGKVDRRALPAPDTDRSAARVEYAAPRHEVDERLTAIWAEVLQVDRPGIDDNFFSLGGESFKAIRAVRKIGMSVSVMDLFKYPTVRQLADYLAQGQPKSEGVLHELTRPIPAGARKFSVICIPYAGGSAITFQPLARSLPPDCSLYALEPPGHDFARRTEALLTQHEVAQRCVEEVKRFVTGPIVLYGHCMGGALTTEIAYLLEEAHLPLVGVFIGGHFPTPRLPGRFFEWMNKVFPLERMAAKRLHLEDLRNNGFFADLIDPDEQEYVIRNYLHDVKEGEDYYTHVYALKNQPKLKAPIVCVIGEKDRMTEFYPEQIKEWEFFSDSVETALIPGAGHYFMKHQAAELGQIITTRTSAWQWPPSKSGAPAAAKQPQPATSERESKSTAVSGAYTGSSTLRIFFLVVFGQFVSLIGTALTTFALGVWVFQKTGAVGDLAAIFTMALLPGILVAPVAGAAADRWDRRWIMILSDTLAACGSLALALLLGANALRLWHILVVISVDSIAIAFQRPAYMAAVTQLVPKRYLGRANGIVQLGGATGNLVAPLLGGMLVVTIGLSGVILIDFATFLFSMTTLLLARFPNTLFHKQEEPWLREIAHGWRFIIRRRGLVAMVIFFVVVNGLFSVLDLLTTPYVLSFGTPAMLGTIMGAFGLGLLLGGIVMALWGGTRRRTNGLIGFVMLIGVSGLIIGLWPTVLSLSIGMFATGIALSLVNAHWQTIVQTKVGLELQGRVVSTTQMLVMITLPLGYLIVGPLADKVFEPLLAVGGPLADNVGRILGVGAGRGMGLMIALMGLLMVLWVVFGYRYRPLRLLEDELPDAIPDAIILDRDALQTETDRRLAARTEITPA